MEVMRSRTLRIKFYRDLDYLVQDLRSRIGQDQGEAWRIGKSENKTRKTRV